MNRINLLGLFLIVHSIASAQTVILPYNPDANQDSVIGAPDLLEFLPYFGGPFIPGEVLMDGQTLSEYIAALEEAAASATTDTITIPMLPGTTPGEMLYWNGAEWSLVPVGQAGHALILDGSTPSWMNLKTGCRDANFAEYDPEATVDDGSCLTAAVPGCMDDASCNFNVMANVDDGTCEYATCSGCLDSEACNWDATALIDDGTCDYSCLPCSVPWACNYDGLEGSMDSTACDLPQMDGADCNGDCLPGWIASEAGCELDSTSCTGGMFANTLFTPPLAVGVPAVYSFLAYGQLDSIHVTSHWSGNDWNFPNDMNIEIRDPYGRTVVISSPWDFDEFETADLEVSWPLTWESSEPGDYSFGVEVLPEIGGNGTWQLTVVQNYAGYSEYSLNLDFEGLCIVDALPECPDPYPCNYSGCTDSAACNYNPFAIVDDGTCTTPVVEDCVSPTMDGHSYGVVEIGDQCWFAENLRTKLYANGDVIPAGLTDGEWVSTTAGATAVYGEGSSPCENWSPDIDACDDAQSLAEYGRLYNWYAVDDARGLCPTGWHVPTDGDWTGLEDYITSQGFYFTEGTALKSTAGWYDNGNGTDDFGFSALPGGFRYHYTDNFSSAGSNGYWWSSSYNGGSPWSRYLFYISPDVHRTARNQRFGASVRCLRHCD